MRCAVTAVGFAFSSRSKRVPLIVRRLRWLLFLRDPYRDASIGSETSSRVNHDTCISPETKFKISMKKRCP